MFKPSIRQVLADENPAVLSAPVQVKIRLGASGPISLGVPGTYDPELTEILTNSEDAMSDSVNNFAFQGVGTLNIPIMITYSLVTIFCTDAELLDVTKYIMKHIILQIFDTGPGFIMEETEFITAIMLFYQIVIHKICTDQELSILMRSQFLCMTMKP